MLKTTITLAFLVIFVFTTFQSYAEIIELDGENFNLSLANPLSLKINESNKTWVLQSKFAKLTFHEFAMPQKNLFNKAIRDVESAPNRIMQGRFGAIIADNSLIIDHSMISDTEFIRFQKLIGNNQNAVSISFTIPLKHANELKSEINEMLTSISWKSTEVVVLKQSPKIQFTLPKGYKIKKKYLNSVVLVTTQDNVMLRQGNVVISFLPEVTSGETLEEITIRLLSEAKTLDKIQIEQVYETKSLKWPILKARAKARYEQTQIEVDISHAAIKIGQEVVFIQVSAPRNAESFLKLEHVASQFLDALEHYSE